MAAWWQALWPKASSAVGGTRKSAAPQMKKPWMTGVQRDDQYAEALHVVSG
jgi:hypothetical protein